MSRAVYHFFVITLVLLLSGCATRLQPPIVQAWTAVLLHDRAIVHVETVTQLFPYLTLTQCRHASGLSNAAWRPCAERVFRFVTLDRKRRTVTYRELVP